MSNEIHNESELIHKAQDGDVAAFEQLIENYQQPVFNLAYRMIGNQDDASDIAQEAFIKVYTSISRFKGNSKFSTWIYRITTNVCLDEIRKRKRLPTFSLSESIDADEGEINREIEDKSANVEMNFEIEQRNKIINEAILKLPEKHRAVIVLRDVNNLSYDQIAATLDCSEGTVKSRIARAREKLYEILKDKL